MITEDYVSYEVAKLLEEKGFPMGEHLFMHVNKDNVFMTDDYACLELPWEEYKNFDEVYIPTITHQMAMKWLREKGILVLPDVRTADGKWFCMIVRRFEEVDNGCTSERRAMGYYDNYKEAVEAALKYCLTELI